LRVGGAQVSEMHCNFLINTGAATGMILKRWRNRARKVKAHADELHWEIKRIGIPA